MIPRPGTHGTAPKILVVDDEEDIVAYLTAVLEDNGFRAVGVSNPAAALDTIQAERPDLILLDIMMPGQSGLALYRAIRADPATAGIPVLIVSGYSREEDFAQAVRALQGQGSRLPDGYLEKPIAISTLLQDLRGLLDRRANEASRG